MRNQNDNQWMLLLLIIKEIAEQKKMSIDQVAAEAEMEPSTVNRLFSLKFKPTLPVFMQLAKSVKVSFSLEDLEGKADINDAMDKAIKSLKNME